MVGSTVVAVMSVVRLTSSTGGTDGNGAGGLELEELHCDQGNCGMSDLFKSRKSAIDSN